MTGSGFVDSDRISVAELGLKKEADFRLTAVCCVRFAGPAAVALLDDGRIGLCSIDRDNLVDDSEALETRRAASCRGSMAAAMASCFPFSFLFFLCFF